MCLSEKGLVFMALIIIILALAFLLSFPFHDYTSSIMKITASE